MIIYDNTFWLCPLLSQNRGVMFMYMAMHGAGAWVLAVSGPWELEEGCHCPGPNLHVRLCKILLGVLWSWPWVTGRGKWRGDWDSYWDICKEAEHAKNGRDTTGCSHMSSVGQLLAWETQKDGDSQQEVVFYDNGKACVRIESKPLLGFS